MDKFSMDVDVKALIEQDPEFREYLKEAVLGMLLMNIGDTASMIGALHGFYQTGMTQEQIAVWFRSIQLFNLPGQQ